jgi:oxalate decarboxylase
LKKMASVITQKGRVEPIDKDGRGATDTGPRDLELDKQNPDILVPPTTDRASTAIPNLKWPFSLSPMRISNGGWARETTVRELPVSTTMAGVNMKLKPGAIRELHWHKEGEWAYMISGHSRITCVNPQGQNFIADVAEGDLWFFPGGWPHSIQGLKEGCEFLLVFPNGAFSENSTFLLTDWLIHVPREVSAKNFNLSQSDFSNLPAHELYIFEDEVPGPLDADLVPSPHGATDVPLTFRLMEQKPIKTSGGTVRKADSTNFKASTEISGGLVEVEPGAMRELHWHPAIDEWQYYLEGTGRMGVFGSGGTARTFDYRAGDVGFVPKTMGHYVENTGDTPLRFLELFNSEYFLDVSLNQWLAMIPPKLVRAHLGLGDKFMRTLNKEKRPVVK